MRGLIRQDQGGVLRYGRVEAREGRRETGRLGFGELLTELLEGAPRHDGVRGLEGVEDDRFALRGADVAESRHGDLGIRVGAEGPDPELGDTGLAQTLVLAHSEGAAISQQRVV